MSEPRVDRRTALSLSGVFPPIPTPFDARGDVDHEALAANLSRWNRYALSGYVVLGSNGEAAYLTESEKADILETARREIPPDKLLVAGTGAESTRQTIALTQRASGLGVDVALVITPCFFGAGMTPDSLVRHFHAVAEASPIPVVLYNVPKFTHLDVDAQTIARIARHPNVIGVKDSGGNITKIGDTIRLAGPGFQVLAGSAGFFFAALVLGAVGGVLALANVAPQQCVDIFRSFAARRWDDAAELQRQMIPVNAAITAQYGIAGLKAALDMLGYRGGAVRPPLLDLGEPEQQALREVLEQGGLL